MAERSIKGDYIGFTFGGVHSSELGLVRVSDGSRYNEDLLPPLQDKKVQVAGRDGEVYFGSQYNTKPIKVPVAFDNMTEESFRELKRLLQDKKPKYLWFDETPYKQWFVKSANAQNFKWVCFDESRNGKEKRIYKGEGTIEFSCFSSYAESRINFLDDPVDSIIYREKKKLKIGNPPYLEELTVKTNYFSDVVHIYSDALLNESVSDNVFEIPNYGTFDISGSNEEIISEKQKYVQFYEDKGFTTLVEHESPKVENGENQDETTDGLYGVRTTFLAKGMQIKTEGYLEGIYNWFRCYIITKSQLELLGAWYINSSENNYVLTCQNYGHHYPNSENVTFLRSSEIKKGDYVKWNLMPTDKGYVLLLVKDEIEEFRQVVPIWQETIEERTNILLAKHPEGGPVSTVTVKGIYQTGGVKILSPKGFQADEDGSLKVAKKTLQSFYNFQEWKEASGLKERVFNKFLNLGYNQYINQQVPTEEGGQIQIYGMIVYNAGDIPAAIQLTFDRIPQTELEIKLYSWQNKNNVLGSLTLKPIKKVFDGDVKIIFDSKLKMLKGADRNGEATGTVYNSYRKSGDFFKLPTKEILSSKDDFLVIEINQDIPFEIKHKHYYI